VSGGVRPGRGALGGIEEAAKSVERGERDGDGKKTAILGISLGLFISMVLFMVVYCWSLWFFT
jgi:hypothetical protein